MNRRRFLSLLGGSSLSVFGLGRPAAAQQKVPGVSALEIRLGTSLGLTGSDGPRLFDYLLGFVTQIDETNAIGGIHNRQLTLLALDHGDQPDRAIRNTLSFHGESDVFSLVAFGSTDPLLRVLPLLARGNFRSGAIGPDFPLFGALSGTQALYSEPYRDRIFRFRPSFREEMAALLDHLLTLDRQRVGICYPVDGTGRAIREALDHGLQARGLSLAAEATCAPRAGSIEPALKHLKQTELDTVICALDASQVIEWTRLSTELSWQIPIALPSTVGGEALLAGLQKQGRADLEQEILQSRVVPTIHENRPEATDFVTLARRRRTQRLDGWRPADAFQKDPLTAAGLEGFLTARALVEALERAGPDLTRPAFRETWRESGRDTATFEPIEPLETLETPETSDGLKPSFERARIYIARASPDGKWREVAAVFDRDLAANPSDSLGSVPLAGQESSESLPPSSNL